MKFSTIATSLILVLSCVTESYAANSLKIGRYGAMSSEGNKIKNTNDDECWVQPDNSPTLIVSGVQPHFDTRWCSWGIFKEQRIQRVVANGNELTVFIGNDSSSAWPYNVSCDGDGALWQFSVGSGFVNSKEIHKDKYGIWVYGDNYLVDYSYNNGSWSLIMNNKPVSGYDMPNINLSCTYPILV